jgi:hypothetical protein
MVDWRQIGRTVIPGIWADAMEGRDSDTPAIRMSMSDQFNRRAHVSQSGELIIGSKSDDISVNFQYQISTKDIRNGGSQTGTGSVDHLGSTAGVSTGTGVGSAIIETRDAIRYRPGHECYLSGSCILAPFEENVNQYFGFLNNTDGICYGAQGLEDGLWFIEGGNVQFTPRSEWNVDKLNGRGGADNPSGYKIDPQTGQVPNIKYVWHGFRNITIEVIDENGNFIPCHKLTFINTATQVHLENPHLPVSMKIERTQGTGADLTIECGSIRAGVVAGQEEDNASNRWFPAFTLDNTVTGGSDYHLLTLRSKASFQGKNNHLKTRVKILVSTNNTNQDAIFFATRLAALNAGDQSTITGAFVDVDTEDSVMEKATNFFTLTSTLTEAQFGDVAVVQRSGQRDNTDVLGFDIYPTEDTVFGVRPGGNGEVSFQLNFVEFH